VLYGINLNYSILKIRFIPQQISLAEICQIIRLKETLAVRVWVHMRMCVCVCVCVRNSCSGKSNNRNKFPNILSLC
jgi:hypothetical protein